MEYDFLTRVYQFIQSPSPKYIYSQCYFMIQIVRIQHSNLFFNVDKMIYNSI